MGKWNSVYCEAEVVICEARRYKFIGRKKIAIILLGPFKCQIRSFLHYL